MLTAQVIQSTYIGASITAKLEMTKEDARLMLDIIEELQYRSKLEPSVIRYGYYASQHKLENYVTYFDSRRHGESWNTA